MKEREAELERIMTPPKYHESMGEYCVCCGWPMPNSEGHMMMRDFISSLLHQAKQQTIVEMLERVPEKNQDRYHMTNFDQQKALGWNLAHHALITYAKEQGIDV